MNPDLMVEADIEFISAVHSKVFDGINTNGDDFFLKFLFDHAGKYPENVFTLLCKKM